MFRAFSRPSPGATTTAVAASGLPSELGDRSAVGRGRVGSGRVGSGRVGSVLNKHITVVTGSDHDLNCTYILDNFKHR
jgi:hypothetical protein